MKRYLLFAGTTFDDLGGWNDFRGDFDNIDEARAKAIEVSVNDIGQVFLDWYHVVDSVERIIVMQGRVNEESGDYFTSC